MSNHHPHLHGWLGGFAVKHMIESVEKRMAAGEQISAKPSNEAEKAALEEAKQLNRQSKDNSQNSVNG